MLNSSSTLASVGVIGIVFSTIHPFLSQAMFSPASPLLSRLESSTFQVLPLPFFRPLIFNIPPQEAIFQVDVFVVKTAF